MKRILITAALSGAMVVVGFFAGRAYQSAKTGYRHELIERKNYDSALGPVEWTCFLESVGLPFLDSEKTMITLGNRTIYKAQRDFQEHAPFAQNIHASSNAIGWDDGDLRYHLTVTPMTKDEQNRAANGSQPFRSETNSTSSPAGSRR